MTETILLVDDDEDFLLQQQTRLEKAGYQVQSARTLPEARDLLAAGAPDLAVVDLMMEHSDAGFTLCYQIKQQYPAVPVIICSGVAAETGIEFDAATPEEREWVKADRLLEKPIRFEQLQAAIVQLLQGRHG